MWCPFLRETEVRSCDASPFRKLIESGVSHGREICSTPDHAGCPLLAGAEDPCAARSRCAYLRTRHVLFCEALPVRQFVPYSDAIVSICQGDGHRYCEAYLSLADAPHPREDEEEIEAPLHLYYAPNHLWLDRREDSTCVIGMDAFVARVLGPLSDVVFLATTGLRCPSVAVSAGGLHLPFVFPNPLELTGINVAVREDPGRVNGDPYLRGWLFRGRDAGVAGSRNSVTAGLRTGQEAADWIRSEWNQVKRFALEAAGRGA